MRHYSTAEISEQLGVSADKILDWIHDGSLPAVNLARRTGGKSRWRIAHDDLEAFLLRRRSQPPAPAPKRKRRTPETVTRYY